MTIEGQVRNIDKRPPNNGQVVMHFRVEQFDTAGTRKHRIPVRYSSFGGPFSKELAVNEGDHVRVSGRWDKGTVNAERVDNLTSGSRTDNPGFWRAHKIQLWILAGMFTAMAIFFLVAVVLFGWFSTSFTHSDHGGLEWFNKQSEQMHRDFCQNAANAGVDPGSCNGYLNGSP